MIGGLPDQYTIMARMRPALLMVFPALVAAVALLPGLHAWWSAVLSLCAACGVAAALGEFAQGHGKRLEPRLTQSWDGLPSVTMLRHRDQRLDPATKVRYRRFLTGAIGGDLAFPDDVAEAADPADADNQYMTATRWLLARTRDRKTFNLLFQQNVSYGFRRNLLGLRLYGLAVAVMALAAGAGKIGAELWAGRAVDDAALVAIVIGAAALLFCLIAVRAGRVTSAADAYALELLEAGDVLAAGASLRTPKKKAAKKKAA